MVSIDDFRKQKKSLEKIAQEIVDLFNEDSPRICYLYMDYKLREMILPIIKEFLNKSQA